nr:DUF2381 family protein [Myxococcus sp. RHSTA-1-4]
MGRRSPPARRASATSSSPRLPWSPPSRSASAPDSPPSSTSTALAPGSVALEGKERFALVDPARSTLKLVPSEQMVPGERFRLTVRFENTSAPASASLQFVVHAAQAEPLVSVHRQPRPAESFRQELQVKDAQLRRCQEDNSRLRAESTGPGGLAGLLAADVTGDMGVDAEDILDRILRAPSSALRLQRVHAYRTKDRVGVRLALENPAGGEEWTAEWASLVLAGRRDLELKVLVVWQKAPIPGGESRKVVVEAEAPDASIRGPFVLKLWAKGGTRPVTLSGVTFP